MEACLPQRADKKATGEGRADIGGPGRDLPAPVGEGPYMSHRSTTHVRGLPAGTANERAFRPRA